MWTGPGFRCVPTRCASRLRSAYPQVVDGPLGNGPIAGIIAAQAQFPDAAWLVVACDLPQLDDTTLEDLKSRRDPRRLATAFLSDVDGMPEPLCAIYEPASREADPRPRCRRPRLSPQVPDDPRRRAAGPGAAFRARQCQYAAGCGSRPRVARRKGSRLMPRLHLHYYALLREQAGIQAETIDTAREHAIEALRGTCRPSSLPPACLPAEGRRQCGIQRLGPGARGRRRSRLHTAGGWRMNAFEFTQEPIDAARLAAPLALDSAGGFAAFEGRVRDVNEGRDVTGLAYEALRAACDGRRRTHRRRRNPANTARCVRVASTGSAG